MCLQWCAVHRWLIDNDLPCIGCCYRDDGAVAGRCETCAHRREGADGPMCALTQAPLPRRGGCCHANVDAQHPQRVSLDALSVAPWVFVAHGAMDIESFLTTHHSMPVVTVQDGRAWVDLGALARPLVYGVPASAWDDALDGPAPMDAAANEAIPAAPPHVAAAMEVLDGLVAETSVDAAAERLRALLVETPLEAIPAWWRGIVAETMALLHDRGFR